MPMQLDPAALRGRRSACQRTTSSPRPTPRRSRWRASRRARAAVGHCAAPDRRARPPRPRLDLASRESLCDAAADRSGAARALRRQLSFVAALAVHDAVADVRARCAARLALKWPNDLLFDGAKFAGILIEGEGAARPLAVAVGIGVNCGHHPERRRLSRRPISPPRALRVAGDAVRALCRAGWRDGSRIGTVGRALPRSAPTGSRAPPVSASRSRVRLAGRRSGRPFRDARRARAAWCCGSRTARRETITAGDVFPLATARSDAAGMAALMAARDELVFAPLGGVGEIGMNLVALRLRRRAPAHWLASISASPSPPRSTARRRSHPARHPLSGGRAPQHRSASCSPTRTRIISAR